jgi:hypothetical protein
MIKRPVYCMFSQPLNVSHEEQTFRKNKMLINQYILEKLSAVIHLHKMSISTC